MKTIFKAFILLFLSVLFITLAACNKQTADTDQFIQESQIDSIVSKAISDFAASNRKTVAVFEAHKIFGKELNNDTLSVYVVGFVMGVHEETGDFGGEFPAHIKIQKVEEGYKVIDYKDALASLDVYNIMPKKYAKDILKYDTSGLQQTVKKQFEEWQKNNQ